MREILFRGKRVDNGEWVYGFYSQFHNRPTINEPNSHQIFELIDEGVKLFGTSIGGYWRIVDPETVGQYTGLTDENGKEIFEGDIVECFSSDFAGRPKIDTVIVGDMTDYNTMVYLNCSNELKVIGNIHDNPELLKEGADNG